METKPFSLQSPEAIAKEYGGNKQKIAEAMQMGVIDPTAGTLAGMFIDRMRAAAQAEAAPQKTVAQQVFAPPQMPAPPQPPAGLGATPEAASMIPNAPTNPTAPIPYGSEDMAPQAPVPGMAMGGLTTLSVPDYMFDEPDNGGYAGGGLVAFATGGLGKVDEYGRPLTIEGATSYWDALSPVYNDQYERIAEAEALKRRNPEEMKKLRKQDMWEALAMFGSRLATTPGGLLQGAAASAQQTLPEIAKQKAARKIEEKQALDDLLGIEGQRYNRKGDRIKSALGIQDKAITADEAKKTREQAAQEAKDRNATTLEAARIAADAAKDAKGGMFTANDFGNQLAKFVAAKTKFEQANAVTQNRPNNRDYKKTRIEAHADYFAQNNVLRAMQGQPPLSLAEFNNAIGYAQPTTPAAATPATPAAASRVPNDFRLAPRQGD